MLVEIALLVLGFVFLIKGADLLVDGGSSLAKRWHVPDIVIGLTIVAFGTSAPELVVNLMAAFTGSPDLALGNILGSNISNTLLILGVAGLIYPLQVKRGTVWKEIPLVLLASLAVTIMGHDVFLEGLSESLISRTDGLVLLLFFAVFLYYTFGVVKDGGREDDIDIVKRSVPLSSLMIVSGIIALTLGGRWIVESAIVIAGEVGLPESVIGLTIVAIGTSLPELATSVVAAFRKNVDIAVGNVVGSNIFNLLFVLAATSSIYPLPIQEGTTLDFGVMLFSAFLLFLAMFTGKKHELDRWESGSFILLYVAYISSLFIRL